MKYFSLFIISFIMLGCTGEQIAHSVTKTQIAMSGNKPPTSYKVANLQTMRDYVFETKYFSFKFPTAEFTDFSNMGGWSGMSMSDDKTIVFGFDISIVYHVSVSTSGKIRKITERELAIMNNDMKYLKNRFPTKTRKGKKYNINIRTIRGGKENYPCIVRESYHAKYEKRKISYGCFKIDSSGLLGRGAGLSLTYNKPKDPKLAKQYTYQDLQKRAKRTLDSLYIKDGW